MIQSSNNYNIVSSFICWNQNIVPMKILATSKGSDQTAHVHRLIGGFTGRTLHIVGNLISRLNYAEQGLSHSSLWLDSLRRTKVSHTELMNASYYFSLLSDTLCVWGGGEGGVYKNSVHYLFHL